MRACIAPVRTPADPRSTYSRCFRTPRATSTWGTCATTRSATSSRARPRWPASRCSTRSAGTRSVFLPRTPRSRATATRPSGPTPTSTSRWRRSSAWVSATTGSAPSRAATSTTTAGDSGSSSRCGSAGSSSGRARRSTGARAVPPSWRTSRSWATACAGDARAW